MRIHCVLGILLAVVGVAIGQGANVLSSSPSFPEDAEGQAILLQETITALLQLAEEFEDTNPLQQEWETVPEVIERYGYPVEEHEIETGDGYLLTAHRIPYGRSCGVDETVEGEEVKRVVWLQHGLMGDSSNWVITGNESRGLAFELADACYDVWMGNFRGNTYSKRHVELDPSSTEFWNFSWHELGLWDVPANIDFALRTTGETQLYYIGHSMGTTSFFITMSERPEYNDKVKLFSALAPVTYMTNARSMVVRLMLGFLPLFETLQPFQLLNIETTRGLAAILCKNEPPTAQPLCELILYLIGGYNKKEMDLENLPSILEHSPAGSSSKTFIHYGQSIMSGEFREYDYKINGTVPKSYNLSMITVPTAMYYSDGDYLADKVDVLRSLKYFAEGTIVRVHRIEDDFWSHLDFVWGLSQHNMMNKPVMDFMEEFTNPPPPTGSPGGAGAGPRYHQSILSGGLFGCLLLFLQ